MNNKIVSVIWFAIAGTAIGYGMKTGYQHFYAAEGLERVIGYLAVFVTTGCSVVGMISVARAARMIPKSGSHNLSGHSMA
jgi:hypothetical protein